MDGILDRLTVLESQLAEAKSALAELRKEVYGDLFDIVTKVDVPKSSIENWDTELRRLWQTATAAAEKNNYVVGILDGHQLGDNFGLKLIMPTSLQTKAKAIAGR